MEKLELIFSEIILDSQVYGSSNEHMISRIFFFLNGKNYECNVRQPHGENFSFENNPIEVEAPDELKKLLNYEQFRDEVEKYFRKAIGSNGRGIHIEGATNVTMRNININIPHKATIDKAGMSGGW